jgi:hypothetical protein
MNAILNTVSSVYKDLVAEKQNPPDVKEVFERVVLSIYENSIDTIADYYQKNECYADYNRVMTEGLCKEDFDAVNIDIEFDHFDIMHYLDFFHYTYEFENKIYNNAQTSLIDGW